MNFSQIGPQHSAVLLNQACALVTYPIVMNIQKSDKVCKQVFDYMEQLEDGGFRV